MTSGQAAEPPGLVRIGAVTIGQSPRDDVVPDLAGLLPASVQIIQRGALDGTSPAGLARLAPADGEEVLVTRLREGREVAVAESAVLPLLQHAVDEVCERGARAVAVLCTATFPLRCAAPLLWPGAALAEQVGRTPGVGRLGVVVPAAAQVNQARSAWGAPGRSVFAVAASPYGPPAGLRAAAETLAGWRSDLVVLDGIGFGHEHRRLVRQTVAVPLALPRAALAEAITEAVS